MGNPLESGPAAGTPEPALIALARSGDTLAWSRLVHAYDQPVFRLAALKLGDAEEARDVAQDTFVQAFLHLSRFDASRPLKPWLLRIASRLAANRRRGIGRYRHMKTRWWVQADAARNWVSTLPDAQQSVWAAVHRLPLKAQDVIWLRYFLELSESETADTLGIAKGTVKSRTSRALGRLGEVISNDFPDLVPGCDTNG